MHERVTTIISECYTNLQYVYDENKKKEVALNKIHILATELNLKYTDTLEQRFLNLAKTIEQYLDLFMSVCEHVDVINTILDYLYYYGAATTYDYVTYKELPILVMLTIYSMCIKKELQLFLEIAIVPEQQEEEYYYYKQSTYQHFEMILLEDSDLHAVIKCLKPTSVMTCLNKIWVQKSIEQTFDWHLKKYFKHLTVSIHVFQSNQELLAAINQSQIDISNQKNVKINTISIMSIWSEDVIAAKNLAESLNEDIIFINAYMDLCCGILFPFVDVHIKSIEESLKLCEVDECTNPINPNMHGLIYNHSLFYNGRWQIPVKCTYWIHNNMLFANATREDILKCAASAVDGFKIWSNMSNKSRMRILSNFANILKKNKKFKLAEIILNWIKLSYIREGLPCYYQNDRLEVIRIPKPLGTVILKEKDECTLFRELTQSLIIGNSVIVICNPNLYILAPYYDMIKHSEIPPGVINFLSSKKTDFRYDIIKSNSTLNNIYYSLSLTKFIIVSRD
ncbi:uncharacterized protein [Anoplolepis gracilipes]|uniref:uncharacterized protein n=1 Tax=Anoplolepis gracilipes TaxID=354296 RepID=UPI003BA26A57